MKKTLSLAALLVAGLGSTALAYTGASDPNAVEPVDGWVLGPGRAPVLLIETTTTAVDNALNDLGVVYDLYVGDNFSALNLAGYDHVFVAMDGGIVEAGSINNVAAWAEAGGCLHIYGGTCWQNYAIALNNALVGNDFSNYCWQISSPTHSTVTNAGHYLAVGLPASYNFADIAAAFYQTRAVDGSISVAARNGDQHDHLFSKSIGAGNLDVCINSPYEFYYANLNDYNWLKTVVDNMLTCGGDPVPTETTSWGRVKSLYQ